MGWEKGKEEKKYLLTPFKMGEDNITLGRQILPGRQHGKRGGYTHLLKEHRCSLAGKRCPRAKGLQREPR